MRRRSITSLERFFAVTAPSLRAAHPPATAGGTDLFQVRLPTFEARPPGIAISHRSRNVPIKNLINNGIAGHKHVETDDDLHPRLNRGGKVSEVRRMRLSLMQAHLIRNRIRQRVVEDATSAMNKPDWRNQTLIYAAGKHVANMLPDLIQIRIHIVRPQSLKRVFTSSAN